MRGVIFLLLAIACLSVSGCTLPGDSSPYGGSGGTYNSNTADEAKNSSR
ncbi:MAG TPA: hypothetical protein VHC22_33770 [Pirellulales bacterium]|nr:hypothetical protein [Pirellulales bacterium]